MIMQANADVIGSKQSIKGIFPVKSSHGIVRRNNKKETYYGKQHTASLYPDLSPVAATARRTVTQKQMTAIAWAALVMAILGIIFLVVNHWDSVSPETLLREYGHWFIPFSYFSGVG